ncbi:MAG: hypothetical protein ABSA17_06375 [Rhabdochlamydiaceae bacterium]|jgi:hypothetical protein
MSIAKAGLPPPAVDDFESCQELLLRIWNTYEPGVKRPSNQVTPEDKSLVVAAAMQAKFKSQMSKIYVEMLSIEGILRGQIYERDERIEGLQKELEESQQNALTLRDQLFRRNHELKLALREIERLKAERVKVYSQPPSGK